MLLISEIQLPQDEDPAAFATFMEEEWIPAVRMSPTRIGQAEELRLVQEAGDAEAGTGRRFLLLVDWSGMSHPKAGAQVDDDAVVRKFERFGASLQDQAVWADVARRQEPT